MCLPVAARRLPALVRAKERSRRLLLSVAVAGCALAWIGDPLGHAATPAVAAQDAARTPAPVPAARRNLERLARKVEHDLVGDPNRLASYVEFFRQQRANDPRLFAWQVTAETDPDGAVRLDGFVEFPETRAGLHAFLQVLGFHDVKNNLETLPAADLGEERFGIVRVPHTQIFDRPGGHGQVVTEALWGEPLFLLREQDGDLLAHTAEGYLGYVWSGDVRREVDRSFAEYFTADCVRVQTEQRTERGQRIPAGCRLRWVRDEADRVVVELPNREQAVLPVSACRRHFGSASRIDEVLKTAESFRGTRYLWGGRTAAGMDCSGLIQVSFAAVGLHLPRDSNQQIYLGQLTATRWFLDGLRRGDTLYFLGAQGKIRHTAIYLGDRRYLHAESPVVRISSFDPQAADYDAARHASFAFAKRLLD